MAPLSPPLPRHRTARRTPRRTSAAPEGRSAPRGLLPAALLLVTALLVLAAAGPAVQAGSAEDPEASDSCGDVDPATQDIADVEMAWWTHEPATDILTLHIQLCTLADNAVVHQVANQRRASERIMWITDWADSQGGEWSVRFWLEQQGEFDNDAHENVLLCRDGEATTLQGTFGTGALVRSADDPVHWKVNFQNSAANLHDDLTGLFLTTGRTLVGGGYDDCAFAPEDEFDRVPDEGFGDPFTLPPPEPAAGGASGVEVASPDTNRTTFTGIRTVYDLTFNSTVDEDRTVVLTTTAPAAWSPAFGAVNATVHVPPQGTNRTNLTLTVPASQPLGTFPFDVTGAVHAGTNTTGDPLGDVRLGFNLTVVRPPFAVEVSLPAPPGTLAPGGSGELVVELANTGTEDDTYTVTVAGDGDADGWVRPGTRSVPVAAGGTGEARFTLSVPEAAAPGSYDFDVTATSAGDGSVRDVQTFAVEVAPNGAGDDGFLGLGDPGPAGVAPLLAAAVLAAVFLGRRRGGGGEDGPDGDGADRDG